MRNFLRVGAGILSLAAALSAVPASAAEELTFKQVMRGLAEDMGYLGNAIFVGDFAKVEATAGAIANHPRPSVAERQRVMKILGTDMMQLRKADEETHVAATELQESARSEDMNGVLRSHGRLMNSCVACHTAFRHRLAQP